MNITNPSTITRSGLKYWLEPDGSLYQTEEHSTGAKRWAMQNLDDPLPTFGVSDLMALGWVRLVTEKSTIWVTGGENASRPELSSAQKKTIKLMVDQFTILNSTTPEVVVGDGIKRRAILDIASPPEAVKKADLKDVPDFYKRKGGSVLGDSVQRFFDIFTSTRKKEIR